jgi:hypothetical protein
MTTIAVNKRIESYDVYIGRGSPFGNPFVIGQHGNRADVIAAYHAYFYNRLISEPGFDATVRALRGKRLGCFCKPAACHGDIIAEYINAI